MSKDQKLVENIVELIEWNDKASDVVMDIISLCRQHDMQIAIEAVESTSHKPASCLTSTKLKILNEAISAIRERFSDE